jgi:hypothetical protein
MIAVPGNRLILPRVGDLLIVDVIGQPELRIESSLHIQTWLDADLQHRHILAHNAFEVPRVYVSFGGNV